MKKIVLSTILAITLGTVSATASIKFYTDANGQVFVTPGEGRTELNVNPQEVLNAMQVASQIKSPEIKEMKDEMKKDIPVFAKSSKIKFSGKHYLGFTHKDYKQRSDGYHGDSTSGFEMRRNYLQVKAYLLEDPKSYLRVTLDSTYKSNSAKGKADVIVKYAYLYLNDVLPSTGVEFGIVHRPWHDYEQNNAWNMRSISQVFMEGTAKFGSSADLGINFKTKTDYFTSEIGIFNGEGYGGEDETDSNGDKIYVGDGTSLEFRTTFAALGNGKKKRKPTKDTYLDASFYGQYNMDNTDNDGETYSFYGLHAVYNMPSFLIAAQYLTANNDRKEGDSTEDDLTAYNGDGYSINMTARFGEKKQYSLIGRYDRWNAENIDSNEDDVTKDVYIYGGAWQQNKNVKWLATAETFNLKEIDDEDYTKVMLTAEVKW